MFRWSDIDLPRYPQIWQCVGMIVGVYGVGYWIAARSPYHHWPIVLVGLLGKFLGPLGFLSAAMRHELPWSWSIMILLNDVIWWIPFGAILYEAARTQMDELAAWSGRWSGVRPCARCAVTVERRLAELSDGPADSGRVPPACGVHVLPRGAGRPQSLSQGD